MDMVPERVNTEEVFFEFIHKYVSDERGKGTPHRKSILEFVNGASKATNIGS
jgi:hypothetical protein